MSERSNYHGHYGEQREQRPQGIVFRMAGHARFSPYMWLSHADYENGHELKLDFGRYDVVIRPAGDYSVAFIFEAIARQQCAEISEKEGLFSIEIIEKEEAAAEA